MLRVKQKKVEIFRDALCISPIPLGPATPSAISILSKRAILGSFFSSSKACRTLSAK